MKLPKNQNGRAALLATLIVFVALTVLWYGALEMYLHFPQPPRWLIVAFVFLAFLGLPGILGAELLHVPAGNASLIVATLFAWFFYFVLCRLILYWLGRRVNS